MINHQPLVSVLMTSYNREKYIVESIESVLKSTYNNLELIISDDCSTDNTFSIAKEFALRDNRIRLYQNEYNLGDYPNRNKAASYALGKYLVIVDSDDVMFENSLQEWIDSFKISDCKFGIFTHCSQIAPFVLSSAEVINKHFFDKPILNFGPVATIIDNNYFELIGGFPTKYGPANDMYYNLKASLRTDVLIFPFPLVNYRIHDGQEINNKYAYLANNYLYLDDAICELDLPLSSAQIDYIRKKNKRRFLINLLKYFYKTFHLRKSFLAFKKTNFSLNDILIAIFQK